MINTLLFKPLKKTAATVLEAVVKFKTFDPFSGLVLYKDDELLCPRKCLAFFFYWLDPSEARISVNEDKIVPATVKACRGN